MVQNQLFNTQGELRNILERSKSDLETEIESMEPDYLLNVRLEDLSQYLISKYSINPPKIHEDEIYVYNQQEVDIDVSRDPIRFIPDHSRPFFVKGIAITIAIPFDNDGSLFYYQPSTFTSFPPFGEINGQEVHLIYEEVEHSSEELKNNYTRDVTKINKYLEWVKRDVESFNQSLESLIEQIFTRRKQKLLTSQGVISGLGIPIRQREDMPQTYAVPEIRRKVKIERPIVKKKIFQPEPTFTEEDYKHILKIIQNMVMVMERSPHAFRNMNEEDLRQHFLVQLNGHYEGQATGETFNYNGKTDILIRVEDKNAFIAECKFWHGEKQFMDTIDQLLGYTSWRDTKTAILVFNRNKDFSNVLEKIGTAIKSHQCYESEQKTREETSFRYLFHQPDDVERKIILTVMAFNIPL